MAHPYWPFFGLRILTPRLELRYPDDDMLTQLASLAAHGIHSPDRMPFSEPWSRKPPGQLEPSSLKFWWGRRAALSHEDWHVPFAVLEDGVPVGVQSVFSKDFAVRRSFETGSWLGIAHQGRGIGTEMRSAVLHFGFAGLGAEWAETGAFEDNPESRGVTAKLGYEPNGRFVRGREGLPATMEMFLLSRATWQTGNRNDILIQGLEACLPLLGLTSR